MDAWCLKKKHKERRGKRLQLSEVVQESSPCKAGGLRASCLFPQYSFSSLPSLRFGTWFKRNSSWPQKEDNKQLCKAFTCLWMKKCWDTTKWIPFSHSPLCNAEKSVWSFSDTEPWGRFFPLFLHVLRKWMEQANVL